MHDFVNALDANCSAYLSKYLTQPSLTMSDSCLWLWYAWLQGRSSCDCPDTAEPTGAIIAAPAPSASSLHLSLAPEQPQEEGDVGLASGSICGHLLPHSSVFLWLVVE
jgi:hypothetical protein